MRAPDAELTRAIASRVAAEYRAQGNAKVRLKFEQKLRAVLAELEAQKRLVEEKRVLMEKARRESNRRGESECRHIRPGLLRGSQTKGVCLVVQAPSVLFRK